MPANKVRCMMPESEIVVKPGQGKTEQDMWCSTVIFATCMSICLWILLIRLVVWLFS